MLLRRWMYGISVYRPSGQQQGKPQPARKFGAAGDDDRGGRDGLVHGGHYKGGGRWRQAGMVGGGLGLLGCVTTICL